MIVLIDTKTANIEGNISDIKERFGISESRLTAIESRNGGVTEVRRDQKDHLGLAIAIIAVIVSIGAIFMKGATLHVQ